MGLEEKRLETVNICNSDINLNLTQGFQGPPGLRAILTIEDIDQHPNLTFVSQQNSFVNVRVPVGEDAVFGETFEWENFAVFMILHSVANIFPANFC